MKLGVIGSGSWATALVKILTDNKKSINWWVREPAMAEHITLRRHNPMYLQSAYFNTDLLSISSDIAKTVAESDCLVIAIPSAYVTSAIKLLGKTALQGKKIVSAVKGILPDENILLNDFLGSEFNVKLNDYYTIMGPCHAEEVAAERLSYLTFSGLDETMANEIAGNFKSYYINAIVNHDIYGVQYAAVLKNIYAIGAGIAHGLEYGDNFLSVLITNAANEMAGFLKKAVAEHMQDSAGIQGVIYHPSDNGYVASVYLGDLLVTCYSLFSRNRTFGNMIGKGYSVKSAQLEMNGVAEGYNACKCMNTINQKIQASMPIANTIYKILWEQMHPRVGFRYIESTLI